jgi:phosphoesterase RecJ-like protein
LQTAADGKLAWIVATSAMYADAGATYEDSDGILDVVRAVRHVELCLFFKETADGRIKVSLRSNGKADAYRIARSLGGGGHRMAAGVSVDGPMEKAIRTVVDQCLAMESFSSPQN